MVDEEKITNEETARPMDVVEAEETQVPTGSTIVVDGVVYAVSLFWQPLQDPDDPIQEIRETAAGEEGSDLYCIRQSGTYQYGLGKTGEGHRDGQVAAAISVADAFSDRSSFVGVFKVKEGWWFIAIRNDVILSEEDVLYLNEEDAQKAFYAMMAVPDWGRKVAPESWGIEGTKEVALSSVLRRSSQVRLVRLSSALNKKMLMIAGAVVLLLGIVAAQFVMSLWGTNEVIQREVVQARVTPVVKVEPEVVIPKPWESLVFVPDMLNRCQSYAYQISSLVIPTWKLNKVVCSQDNIKADWSPERSNARVAWVKTAMQEYRMDDLKLTIDPQGNKVSGVIKFSDLRKFPSPPTLSGPELKENMVDIFQAIKNQVRLVEQSVDVGTKSKPEKASYLLFSFSSSYNPLNWSTFFKKFSGVDLTMIEYYPHTQNNQWKYEGRIYEK